MPDKSEHCLSQEQSMYLFNFKKSVLNQWVGPQLDRGQEKHCLSFLMGICQESLKLVITAMKNLLIGNSLVVWWLGLHAFSAVSLCSIPVQETKIRHIVQSQKTNKNEETLHVELKLRQNLKHLVFLRIFFSHNRRTY